MKIYAIATKSRECYGHGDFGSELKICQIDVYVGQGKFQPVFDNKKIAEDYLKNDEWPSNKVVVELDLLTT